MTSFLDSLKYSDVGLVTVMAQDVDSGAVLMQAFADRAAVCETMQTGLATFYSRSRKASGNPCLLTGVQSGLTTNTTERCLTASSAPFYFAGEVVQG
jgi:phosphoribosyl-AMP cyclohydrolase